MHDDAAPATVSPDQSDPRSAPTVLVGGVGLVLLAVIVLLLEVLHQRTTQAELARKVVAEQPQELRQVQALQREQLNGYRWVDQGQGVVAIPLDRAIDLLVEEARRGERK